MNRNYRSTLIAAMMLMTFGCAQQPATPPDTRAADEAAIRKADMDWSNAAQAKQVDAWLAFYSSDAAVLPPNEPMATGNDAIRKTITDLLSLPAVNLKWQSTKVEVSRSGDIGYSYGTYEMSFNDPKGNPTTDKGKYVEVWKKQADGSWKCAVDTFNTDLPLPPPPPAPTTRGRK